jgi:23S rRNA pseudouridine2605 synthase
MPPKSTPADSKTGAAPVDKKATPAGERIAKVLSRAGIASRREAERLIEIGEVAVNGKVITSPALNVTDKDKITVGGKPVAAAEPARLWLYYKPEGLVTSESDEKGRQTVFETLPPEMPRVMSVGRLDLNSEGLLLLTNDGELKRRLELPSTGWLRKYRVRINGNPTDVTLEPLRKGIVVDGERFQPMSVVLDRIQGANAWLTIGLREGKNREIRRALNALDLYVNRLIRISYGPFRLGDLEPGGIEELKPRILRDQLGLDPMADEVTPQKPAKSPGRTVSHGPTRAGGQPRDEGERRCQTGMGQARRPCPGQRRDRLAPAATAQAILNRLAGNPAQFPNPSCPVSIASLKPLAYSPAEFPDGIASLCPPKRFRPCRSSSFAR